MYLTTAQKAIPPTGSVPSTSTLLYWLVVAFPLCCRWKKKICNSSRIFCIYHIVCLHEAKCHRRDCSNGWVRSASAPRRVSRESPEGLLGYDCLSPGLSVKQPQQPVTDPSMAGFSLREAPRGKTTSCKRCFLCREIDSWKEEHKSAGFWTSRAWL